MVQQIPGLVRFQPGLGTSLVTVFPDLFADLLPPSLFVGVWLPSARGVEFPP